MKRRGTVRFGTCLTSIVMVLSFSTGVLGSTVLDAPTVLATTLATPSDDPPAAPPGTVSEFYPESANLSDCVGLVEKPGCGSGSRGGWRQMLVFVVLFAGLGVILWRVSRGIRSNRKTIDSDAGIEAGADSDTT